MTRAQLELNQYKQEADKRIADKDEELDNLRYACGTDVSLFLNNSYVLMTFYINSQSFSKNHARQLESLQASLETEVKSKSDLVNLLFKVNQYKMLASTTSVTSTTSSRILITAQPGLLNDSSRQVGLRRLNIKKSERKVRVCQKEIAFAFRR